MSYPDHGVEPRPSPTQEPAREWVNVFEPLQTTRSRTWLHVLLFVATFFTTTVAGAYLAHFDHDLVRLWVQLKYHPRWALAFLVDGLAFSVTLMAILTAHEMGHYLMARHYGVASSLPFFIPGPNLVGTFGAVIVMRSRIPDRRALFDIGAAGPLCGLVVTIFAMVVGFATAEQESLWSLDFSGGVLFGPNLLLRLGFLLGQYPEEVMLSSLYLDAACVGFLVTTLNLMPIGQLDGGHIAYAVAGKRSFWMGIAALFGMAALGYWWPPWWFMGALLLLFMGFTGLRHPPPMDLEVRLDPARKILAVVILVILFLIIARVPVAVI